MLVPLDVAPGQELCMPGDPADSLWLLHGGEVQVGALGNGRPGRAAGRAAPGAPYE